MGIHKNLILLIGFVSTVFFTSCEDGSSQRGVIEKINLNFENKILGEVTKTQGEAHSGIYFSRTDAANAFGIGYSLILQDAQIDKKIKVIIEGWARTNIPQSRGTIVITTNQKDSMITWNPIWINGSITEPNKWCYFKDSLLVPRAPTGIRLTCINVFSYLSKSEFEKFDIDDFNVTFKAE